MCAGLPAGRGRAAGARPRWRMGFPCEMRWENKLLPDRRFTQAGAAILLELP